MHRSTGIHDIPTEAANVQEAQAAGRIEMEKLISLNVGLQLISPDLTVRDTLLVAADEVIE